MEQSPNRLRVLKRIEELEREGRFDETVEADPPTKVLLPNKIDYLNKKTGSKIATGVANFLGSTYFDGQIKKGNLIIESVTGLEHLRSVPGGALLSCNHFNPFDNYALYTAIKPVLGKRMLYKVIREGNYTAFGGLYGFFFRHCNTLPLSSNFDTMRLFMKSMDVLLKRGEKILIYPEQAMWWNYRKPRPLKEGAFRFAVRSNAPVVPCFISMRDDAKLDGEGFPLQRYTIHILPPIYPDSSLPIPDRIAKMRDENYAAWKSVYERVYETKLTYSTDKDCSAQDTP